MHKKPLSILALTILIVSTLIGCGQASSTPSTLTILSITEGDVFVMKAGTDNWTEAEVGIYLEVGDNIKTSDDSGAEITFFDGSTIELQAGTEIEIASLDISPDTGATTITLMQTIGTTVSRVTKLLDPASSYEIETSTGVAAVRGSVMLVSVIGDGTTWITNQEGIIWAVAQGVELQIPEGQQCIIMPDQPPELIPIDGQPPEPISSNHPPTDINLDNSSIAENQRYGTVVGYFSTTDPDTGDTFTYSLVSGHGDDNNTSFMIVGSQLQTVNSFDYEIKTSCSIRVRSTDSGMLYYEEVFIITVVDVYEPPVNNPPANNPPLAEDDAAITDEDNPVIVAASGVLNNDSDPDVGDTLIVTSVDTSRIIGVVTAWDTDGSFTYDPNGQFEYLQAGNSTTDSFTYTLSDSNGSTDTANVTITINGVNDVPTYINLDNSSVAENQPSGTAVGNFSTTDPDTGDTFTYSLVSGDGDDNNTSFTIVGSQLQTVASFDYETKNSYSIRVRTTDSGILYYEEAFIITVTNVNDPPVAVDDSDTTPADTPVTIDVLNNDADSDGDMVTVNSVTQGAHGSVTYNAANVTYTPSANFTGTDSFTYTISDGNGGTDTASVTITVTVIETLARINVQIDTGPTASIYIRDNTTGGWAIDEVTQELVDGTNHVTSDTIKVTGGHSYCVWVGAANVTYDVKSYPSDWSHTSAPNGGEAACGYATAGSLYPVHFTEMVG